jgi:hypothetical protein
MIRSAGIGADRSNDLAAGWHPGDRIIGGRWFGPDPIEHWIAATPVGVLI